jgi:hypothetical protein
LSDEPVIQSSALCIRRSQLKVATLQLIFN